MQQIAPYENELIVAMANVLNLQPNQVEISNINEVNGNANVHYVIPFTTSVISILTQENFQQSFNEEMSKIEGLNSLTEQGNKNY